MAFMGHQACWLLQIFGAFDLPQIPKAGISSDDGIGQIEFTPDESPSGTRIRKANALEIPGKCEKAAAVAYCMRRP